jgi:hypothetical protein
LVVDDAAAGNACVSVMPPLSLLRRVRQAGESRRGGETWSEL